MDAIINLVMLTVPTNLFFSTTKYNAVILSEQSSRIPIFIMPTGPLHMQIPLHVFIILDTRLTRRLCARHSTKKAAYRQRNVTLINVNIFRR